MVFLGTIATVNSYFCLVFVVVLGGFLSPTVFADPETVEGLYLTKKSLPQKDRNPPNAIPSGTESIKHNRLPLEQQQQQQQLEDWKEKTGKPFPQAHLGGELHSKEPRNHQQPRAFGNYLKPKWYHQQWNKQLQTPMPILQGSFRSTSSSIHRSDKQPAPAAAATAAAAAPANDVAVAKGAAAKNDEDQLWKLLTQPPSSSPVTAPTTTSTPENVPLTTPRVVHIDSKGVSMTSPTPSPLPPLSPLNKGGETSFQSKELNDDRREKKQDVMSPRTGFLKSRLSSSTFEGEGEEGFTEGGGGGGGGRNTWVGLLIGIVFVAAFVGVGVGLAAQCAVDLVRKDRARQGGGGSGCPIMGRRKDEEGEGDTPPELRGHGVGGFLDLLQSQRSDHAGGGNGQQPLFSGKLILHDPSSSAQMLVTKTLLAAHAAAMMPSPAEQVTHDLVSPKYDQAEDDEDDDEDESDDTVYECPGLAAANGLVVSNPFYLQGGEDLMQHLEEPKPISSQTSIFHHGIKGFN